MILFCLLLTLAVNEAPNAWPGFLGAGATAVEAQSLPLRWSPEENLAWQAKLPGYGQSSPIVWGEQVFVTTIEGPMKETCHVLGIDLAGGKQLWQHSFPASQQIKNSSYVSRAAPTPVTDGQSVFAFFESGDVVALSTDGKPLWRRSLVDDYGKFETNHGLSASPVLTDDAVILLIDHSGPSYLLGRRKSDGTTLWKTDRPSRVSWSSPAIMQVGDSQHVVCSSSGSVDGYDPQTGKLLWSADGLSGNTSNTPLAFDSGRFLVGASLGRGGDAGGNARRSNLAMAVKLVDGRPQAEVLWRAEGATSSFGSPVVHRGVAYWVNRSGVVYAFDAQSGESLYTQRTGQSCWATPLGVGDRVYLLGKDGLTTVLRAGKEFEVLAENQLWGDEQADPAGAEESSQQGGRRGEGMFSGPVQYAGVAVPGSLLIRTGDRLYCLRQKAK